MGGDAVRAFGVARCQGVQRGPMRTAGRDHRAWLGLGRPRAAQRSKPLEAELEAFCATRAQRRRASLHGFDAGFQARQSER